MALTRRSTQRVSGSIWPGFVDAMTALLLVLMFVLTIFMILQYVLQETILGQEDELDELASEITSLAQALGLEQQRVANLEDNEAQLSSSLATAEDQINSQTASFRSCWKGRSAMGTAASAKCFQRSNPRVQRRVRREHGLQTLPRAGGDPERYQGVRHGAGGFLRPLQPLEGGNHLLPAGKLRA